MNYGANTISVLYLPTLDAGNVELDEVVTDDVGSSRIWVRGTTAAGSADLDGGSADAGAADSGPMGFVTRYFGATAFDGATFFPMRVTAIAVDSFGVWGAASDATSVRLFTITDSNVKTDVRTFAVAGTDRVSAGFDDLVAAPTAGDGSTGGVIGSMVHRPDVSVDFGLPPAGSGGTLVVRFDAAGTPLWSKTLGDPVPLVGAIIRRRLRLFCSVLDVTGYCTSGQIAVLGMDHGVSALFLLDMDGTLLSTWHASAGDVVLDFSGLVVAGTNGPNAFIERIMKFPLTGPR
jgi:hypothetical protein